MINSLRKVYNPIQKDYVTFLKTADETNGEYTLVEVELAPNGGVGLHKHKTYLEKFDCLTGELKVQLGDKIHTLTSGMSATAFPTIDHRFFNTSNEVCTFRVELRPGNKGFEQSLQIGYGLARDGQTRKNGIPKSRYALAWLFDISESNLPGWMSMFEWILRRHARKAVKVGVAKHLTEKYVRF